MLTSEVKIHLGVSTNEGQGSYKHMEPWVHFPELEKALVLWLDNMKNSGVAITGEAIKVQVRAFADGLGITEEQIKLSSGWLIRFKDQRNLK